MALICPRCGTQNPDSNSFCLACGTGLAAVPVTPAVPASAVAASPFSQAPPAYTPPPSPADATLAAPPPQLQAPFYAPASASTMQPELHRTPWMLIVGIVVALVIVMTGIGTVLAMGLSRSSTSTANTLSELSSPSPAITPSALPSGAPSAPPPVVAQNVTVPVPDGWTVADSGNEEISLLSPKSDGSVTVASGVQSPPQNAQQNKDTVDAFFREQFPDAKDCPGGKTATGSLNGVNGITWELCFTLTSGAQSAPAAALFFVGANADGTVYYMTYLLTLASNMANFQKEAAPVLKGIVWNLK